MDLVSAALTVVHLLSVIAWLGGMIFHIVVLDPVFRKKEVSFQSAYLLAWMEGRFRKLVGTSIALLLASGAAKSYLLLETTDALLHSAAGRYVLLKIVLTAAMLVIFAVCPKTGSCSPIPGACEAGSGGTSSGKMEGAIRERSRVVLPKVALALGTCALVAAVLLRG